MITAMNLVLFVYTEFHFFTFILYFIFHFSVSFRAGLGIFCIYREASNWSAGLELPLFPTSSSRDGLYHIRKYGLTRCTSFALLSWKNCVCLAACISCVCVCVRACTRTRACVFNAVVCTEFVLFFKCTCVFSSVSLVFKNNLY